MPDDHATGHAPPSNQEPEQASAPSPEPVPQPEPEIFGAIDGFKLSGRVSGWVVKRRGEHYATDLRVVLRRGDAVLAEVLPSGPRIDVTQDELIEAAFVLDFFGLALPEELLDGTVDVAAVDTEGRSRGLEIYAPVLAEARRANTLDALGRADADTVSRALEALSRNPALAGSAAVAVARSRQVLADAKHHPERQQGGQTLRRKATGPRIVFIGAGSTVFAKNLLGDILSEPALSSSRICLYDIDPERLRVSEVVAGRIVQTLGAGASIETTTDLGQALDGADYAINMVQVGGYRPCTVTDFEIPNRYGLRQTIADTLGIGGIMRALRTIPVLVGMTAEMERRCPDVLHLNYVNPMAMNCWALSRSSRIQTVGLCHSVQGTAEELARDIGVDLGSIDYLAAGINHMSFYLRFASGGEDLYPRIRQVAAEGRVPPHNRVRYDLLKRLGYFVTESSEHIAEYVPWYIKQNRKELIGRFNIPLDEYPRRCELQIAAWGAQERELQDLGRPMPVVRSNEYGGRIINAIETGEPAVIYGNVPNSGLIDNLPQDACVEVPCLVDGNGLRPVHVGKLPLHLAALMQTNINVQSLTVEAALTGRREHILHAAMLDPHTAAELDLEQISSLVNELLEAHRAWLPESLFA